MHLPSGIRVTPVAYAASARKATAFPPGPALVLGAHAIDSAFVDLELCHAGTRLQWSYRKPAPATVLGSWMTKALGEWGLRFWFNLCFSSPTDEEWRFDRAGNTLHIHCHGGVFAVACRTPPLLATAHANLAALVEEFDHHGYWHLASRAEKGRFLVLRFNLDHAPANQFAIAHAKTLNEAFVKAQAGLSAAPVSAQETDNLLEAARDIVAWNTVWDAINKRSYTSCSRNWDLEKFGGFGLWLTDTAVSALVHSLFGLEQAQENIDALLAAQTPDGNFPCLLTGKDAWIDRSQPPIVSLIVWLIYLRTGAQNLIARAYEPLLRNHLWWWRFRDGNGDGLLEYGSSPSGDGLYVGTKLAAKNESFMDNSPVHDEASWVESARTLDCADVGLNSLIALDAEMLGLLADALGRETEASVHHARAEAHRARISSHFWDEQRSIFANRLWSGAFVSSVSPTSFFPLLCGAATASQAKALQRHLSDPKAFGGRWGLPSVARRDPAFADNVYWRGRIWPILNWLVWLGLKRHGLSAADDLRRKSERLFLKHWRARLAPENFNAVAGDALDQPDTDPFYSWTALMPLMALAHVVDVDPWQGWCLRTTGPDREIGPLHFPGGSLRLVRKQDWIEVRRSDEMLFATNAGPVLTRLSIAERISLMLPPRLHRDRVFRTARPLSAALQDGKPLPLGTPTEFRLRSTAAAPQPLEIRFRR
ncbi:MAG TPA: trehalase family glycosidase [Aestuariivirgaceae bacterium]